MFYFPTVLQRHGGCFSTIWLVATKGIKVPRRDILKVNVVRTCDDLMDYVLARVPPPRPDLPCPRFSLYLSSQLQYGVVLVFHRQCSMFLDELQTFLSRLVKDKGSQKINLDDKLSAHLLKDALDLMVGTDGAPDPFFGMMNSLMPSPRSLIEIERMRRREDSSDQLSQMSSTHVSMSNDFTASARSITLRETQPAALPAPEFEGEELPEGSDTLIDFLLGVDDDFPGDASLEGRSREGRSLERRSREGRSLERRSLERRSHREREQQGGGAEGITSAADQDLPQTQGPVEETTMLPQDGEGQTRDQPGPPTKQRTPPPADGSLRKRYLDLKEVEAPAAKSKKKKQLVFLDTETQLPPDAMMEQIQNPLVETRPSLLLPAPSHLRVPAARLLQDPCTFLAAEVLSLWRRAATITPVSGSDLRVREGGPRSSSSEMEGELVRARSHQESDVISHSSLLPLESFGPPGPSREVSPTNMAEKETSVHSRTGSLLQDIPEATDEPSAPPRVGLTMPGEEPVSFHSLLPLNCCRKTVSQSFRKLLEVLESRTLSAEQSVPYADIVIFPGENYQSVQL